MNNSKLNWEKAIELLKNGEKVLQTDIEFTDKQIPFRDVSFLNKNSIRVPENLVFYDDQNIDFSDIPEITDEEITAFETSQKLSKVTTSLSLGKDIKNWIKEENIDIDKLVSQLMTNFYHTVKNI